MSAASTVKSCGQNIRNSLKLFGASNLARVLPSPGLVLLCAPSGHSGDYSYELVVLSGSAIIINKEWAYFLLFARTLISVQSPLSGLMPSFAWAMLCFVAV